MKLWGRSADVVLEVRGCRVPLTRHEADAIRVALHRSQSEVSIALDRAGLPEHERRDLRFRVAALHRVRAIFRDGAFPRGPSHLNDWRREVLAAESAARTQAADHQHALKARGDDR